MQGGEGNGGTSGRSPEDITLTATGITLLGVLLSVGVTVGFGVGGEWWVRLVAGVATSLLLVLVAAWSTSTGRGAVARLANWVIGARGDREPRRRAG
ncbi:MAG TPA: hypothetical protein VFY69_07050 [Solirubrobacterales bacterium]|nr:hypothetical protein [Solirubrobacterales bacterium]